jgi:hypothetical protein
MEKNCRRRAPNRTYNSLNGWGLTMKSQVVSCTLLGLLFAFPASAQRGSGRSGSGAGAGQPRRTMPDLGPTNVFLSGKVVLEDGSEPVEGAAIQTICGGQKHTETVADAHGNFSFQFANRLTANTGAGLGDADTTMWSSSTTGSNMSPTNSNRNAQDCELQASLPGFTSQVIELNGLVATSQNSNVGRIVLHRLGQVDGLTISSTSAAAPGAARKAFEKGLKQEADKKWDEAQRSFEDAVRIYEKYAVAWCELGRVQLQKNDVAGARHSFDTAVAADSRYVSPYQQLAQLAVKEKQWQSLVELSGKILSLNSVNFPEAWFLNGVGNFFLQNMAEAEKSARQGLKLDEEKRVPKLDYLLGMILTEKREYTEAAAHYRQYLQSAKTPADAEEARKQLEEVERLSTTASVPTSTDKK